MTSKLAWLNESNRLFRPIVHCSISFMYDKEIELNCKLSATATWHCKALFVWIANGKLSSLSYLTDTLIVSIYNTGWWYSNSSKFNETFMEKAESF